MHIFVYAPCPIAVLESFNTETGILNESGMDSLSSDSVGPSEYCMTYKRDYKNTLKLTNECSIAICYLQILSFPVIWKL